MSLSVTHLIEYYIRVTEYKKAIVKKDVIGLPVGDSMVQVLFLL